MQLLALLMVTLICLSASAASQSAETPDPSSESKTVAPPPLLVRPIPEPGKITDRSPNRKPVAGPMMTASDEAAVTAAGITERVPSGRNRTWVMSFGPGLAYYDGPEARETDSGRFGFSSHLGGVTQLTSDSPFFLGLDVGFQYWNFQSSGGTREATGVQILPTAYYNFDWNFQSQFQPYVGIAVGPHLYFSRSKTRGNLTTVNLEFLFRPGITFLMAPGLSINFEPKIGFIGSDLVFLPQVAANLFL